MKVIEHFFLWVERLYSKKIDATGIGYFRIFYAIVLLCEVLQITYFRHLIFDEIPFIEPAEINVTPGLIVWMISIVFILLGFYTKQAAVVNYVLSLVFIGTIRTYEYHVFYSYMGINFLLMFVNVSKVASLDRLRLKLKYSDTKNEYKPPSTTSVLSYFIIIGVAVAFVYFDSIFFKLSSFNWLNGLGMWLPASLPHVVHVDATPFLNLKWLVIPMGYITFAFEGVFLFTFFRKRWRLLLLFVGLGLHLGILILFPIPWFALTVIGIYILMVPVSVWRRLRKRLSFSKPRLILFYDKTCPFCNRTRMIISHFDVLRGITWLSIKEAYQFPLLTTTDPSELYKNMHGISIRGEVLKGLHAYIYAFKIVPAFLPLYILIKLPLIRQIAGKSYRRIAAERHQCQEDTCGYTPPPVQNLDHVKVTDDLTIKRLKVALIALGIAALCVLQLNVTYHSKLLEQWKSSLGFSGSRLDESINHFSNPLRGVSKMLFGITGHGVFMDAHFKGYNHIIAIEAEYENGNREWLPIIGPDGKAKLFNYSFNWVKWTFRVNSPKIDQEELEEGIQDFATFWAVSNDVSLDSVIFNIYLKKIRIPREWEKDFLKRQMHKPWVQIGEAYWNEDSIFVTKIPDIEHL